MSLLDPHHPIHPEHIPIILSIPAILGWTLYVIKSKTRIKKDKKEEKDENKK